MSGKLFGIFLLFAALLGGGYIVYTYISGGNADIAIAIATPDRVLLGVPFTVTVGVNNASRNVLRAAEVALELPEGAAFLRERREKTVLTKSLGDVGEGSLLQEEFSVLLFGDSAQSLKRFAAVVRYAPSGGGARFEKRQEFIVVADAPGMLLDIIAPEAAVSGEEFEVALSVKNVSDADVHGLRLVADYPAGFEFKKSSLAPDVGNNTWQLGDLRTGSETTLSIRGNVIGPASSTYELRVRLEADFFGERYVVGEKTARVAVAESPLVLTLSVNDNPEYLAGPNETLNYTIAYANNANDALQNAVLKVQLAGALFDLSSLRADGAAIAPFGNSLTWSPATAELAVIPPRGTGTLIFSVRTVSQYPIKRLGDRNFLLKVDARMDADGAPKGVQSAKVSSAARLETKVKGAVGVDAKAFFRDADAGILNKGPIPPRAGTPTNYTAHWLVKNYSTDVSGVTVRAKLGNNVRMTGVVKGVSGDAIRYDDATQEVVWTIERMSATKGVTDKPLEAIFQIEATPSPDLAGQYMPLIGETTATAKDEFTGIDLSATDGAITTALPDDATVGSQGGMVIQ